MASYSPLPDAEDHDYLISGEKPAHDLQSQSPSKWTKWATVVLSILAVACAAGLHVSLGRIHVPRHPRGLRKPNQYPGLDLLDEVGRRHPGPGLYFPRSIIRANKAMPDRVYSSSSHVVLSDNDSMFFQWHMKPSEFTSCYIHGVVPTPEERLSSNKTFVSTGSLAAIEVWNVTAPPGKLEHVSWDTRPQRIGLLGTIAFMPEREMMKELHREDGWQLGPPTPRFACGGEAVYTVEVACSGCTLEFEQVFSFPPLAFDIMQLG
ncbi:hypothetical protein BOTBODRAFT_246239 [Botryobasidium botryosum FD-172 SS1]|uniref:Ubiquitin 3 binding protein But2 C-terminal domain-containing protein n=1 Tax=Botryobasidium botryosum (strain FD-172 SS1) TaxID=930990 RepID=A0A067LTG1_BOTB1|nr:hypothetical protein BOTBODRAFT_246239 [Botryobasidium botryosum FD-172 SS1]